MSNNNVKVGVFNVLANGVSYCSPLWQSDIVMGNRDNIFNALQALTLGKINVEAGELKDKCKKSEDLFPDIITEKLEELDSELEKLKPELKDLEPNDPRKNLTNIITALKTSNLIEHNFIYNIVNAVGPPQGGGQQPTKVDEPPRMNCYNGLKLLQFIENQYNNPKTFKIENIKNFKDDTNEEFKASIENLIKLKEIFVKTRSRFTTESHSLHQYQRSTIYQLRIIKY